MFPAMVELLGAVTEANWPEHGREPQWGKLVQHNDLAKVRGVDAWLAARPAARPLGPGHPAIAVAEALLHWCPAQRATMGVVVGLPLLRGGRAGLQGGRQ